MVHIKGDKTQPCLNPDLIQNQLLTTFPTLTTAALFSYIALITLMHLCGVPYKDKTFAEAHVSKEPNACSQSTKLKTKSV